MGPVHPLRFSIVMKVVSFLKQKTTIAVVLLIIVSCMLGLSYMKSDSDLGNGYKYKVNRGDNLHIRKDNKVVVDSTVIDIAKVGQYIIGLRLPADHLECSGGYKIKLRNERSYFIIATNAEDVYQYSSEDEFHLKVSELDLPLPIMLDYSKLFISKKSDINC